MLEIQNTFKILRMDFWNGDKFIKNDNYSQNL